MNGLSGEAVLVTGATGRVAFPIARALAAENEVYGMARFSDPSGEARLREAGVVPVAGDVAGDLSDLPSVSYVFHAGAALGRAAMADWQRTFEVNAQASGRLLARYPTAKGFVFCSTGSQYEYQGRRPLRESDPPGIHIPVYSLSKIAAEAVVTAAARSVGVPTTIIRIFSTYGPLGGAPADRFDALLRGVEIPLHPDAPNNYNPIYEDDYVLMGVRALLAGSAPPLVVNWAGSETVSAEDYCTYLGSLVGIEPRIVYSDRSLTPLWPDVTYMHEVLGRTSVPWREGMRRMAEARHPKLFGRE